MLKRTNIQKKMCLLAGLFILGGALFLPDSRAEGRELDYVDNPRSVFLVAKTIDRNILTADGENYHITVTYEEDAGIPENAELAVRELTGQEYEAYYAQMEDVVDQIVDARLFDISILSDGEEFHPTAPVTVNISRVGFEKLDGEESVQTVHFGEDEIEVIDTEMIAADGETVDEVRFEAEGFSVYGIAYSVDFHYDVNGKTYDFSIPGGGIIRFADLIEVLGIADQGVQEDFSEEVGVNSTSEFTGEGGSVDAITAESGSADAPLTLGDVTVSDATLKFVSDVEKVEFSTPELLSVSKVEENTTVGAIKDGLGLECEYSAELTEEQIAEIDGIEVQAGDWALISLKAFDTEEYLTVTMKNGDSFQIKVTDAQISTHVLTASGETYKITVTYDDTAEIPDNAELRAREITDEDEDYQTLCDEADQALIEKYDTGLENPILFDIGIYVDDEEIEPAEGSTVKVEIWLESEMAAELASENDADQNKTEPDEKAAEGTDTNTANISEKNDVVEENDVEEPYMMINGVPIDLEYVEKGLVVLHHVDNELPQIISDVDCDTDIDGNLTIEFETDSFSKYQIGNSGAWGISDATNNMTLYVGDEIYINGGVNISGTATRTNETRGDNNHHVIKITGTGNSTGNGSLTINGLNFTVKAYPTQAAPPTITNSVTNEQAGISLDLFDYDLNGLLNEAWNGGGDARWISNPNKYYVDQGLNKNHKLKFWTMCPGYDDPYNNSWDVGATSQSENIVEGTLSGGYPKVKGETTSLAYLFDPDPKYDNATDRKTYANADGLFKYEGGYYIYDSNVNYAYYDPAQGSNGKFAVYNKTFYYDNADLDKRQHIGFFPFHPYTETYESTLAGISGHQQMNHHFGLSMSAKFAIPADCKDIYGNPIKYEFSGDDDMWVFIGDELFMDIGGIHQPVTGTITFEPKPGAPGKINAVVTVNGGQQRIKELDANKEYTLRSFYIERGGGDSNCKIMFNLPTYRTLKLAKRLNGLSANEFDKYKDEWFTYELVMKTGTDTDFTLYKTPDEARKSATNPNPNYDLRPLVRDENGDIIGAVLDANGNATKDEHGNYVTVNLGKTETAANKAQARWLIVDNGQIKLKDGWVVEIPHLSRSDSFYVAEEKTINMDEFEKPHAEREFFTNSDGEHHEEEIDLSDSTTQAQNPDEHKQLADWKTGNMTLQETEKVTFTNTLKEKNIDVEKDWSDGKAAHANDSITFRLVARIPDGSGEGLYTEVHGGNIWGKVTGEVKNGDILASHEEEVLLQQYTLSAKNDWKMRFEHLPAVTEHDEVITYSVEEVSTTPGYVTSDPSFVETYDVDVFKYFPDNTYPNETITFRLLRNGQYYTGSGWSSSADDAAPYTLQRSNVQDENYHCRFTDMPDGTYTVEEIGDTNVLTKGLVIYKRSLKKFTILNMRFSDITAKKVWLKEDGTSAYTDAELVDLLGENVLSSITITGELWEKAANATDYTKVEDFTLDRAHNWTKTWLKSTLQEGSVYQIRNVQETPANIEGFSFSNNGAASFDSNGNIIYSYKNTKDKTTDKLPVEKIWSGDTSFMPSSITVVLQKKEAGDADWTDTDKTLVLTSAVNWKGEFEDLPIKDRNGQLIQYRVKELGVGGWTTVYSTNNGQTLEHPETITITNTRKTTEPDNTSAAVKKVWQINGQTVDAPSDNDAVDVKLVRYKAKPAAVTTTIHFYHDSNNDGWSEKFMALGSNGDLAVNQGNVILQFMHRSVNWYNGDIKVYTSDSMINTQWGPHNDNATSPISIDNNGGQGKYTLESVPLGNITRSDIYVWFKQGNADQVGSLPGIITGVKDASGNSDSSGDAEEFEFDSVIENITLNSSNSWQYEWNNLPKEATVSGQRWLYRYAIEEVTTGDFETEITGTEDIDVGNDQTVKAVPEGGVITVTNKKTVEETPTTISVKKKWYASDGTTDITNSEKYKNTTVKFDLYQVTETTEAAPTGANTRGMYMALIDKDNRYKYLLDNSGQLGTDGWQLVNLPIGADVIITFTPKDNNANINTDYIAVNGVTAENGYNGKSATVKFTVTDSLGTVTVQVPDLYWSEMDATVSIGVTTVSEPVRIRTNVELKADNWSWSETLPGTEREGAITKTYKYYVKEVDNGGTNTTVSGLSEVPISGGEITIKNIEEVVKPTPEPSREPEPEIRKYVEKVSGTGSNDDYNLTLTVKSDDEIPNDKVDVVFVVDTTESMTRNQLDNGATTSWQGINNTVAYLIDKFDNSDVNVNYALTRFWSYQTGTYNDSEVVKDWTSKSSEITSALRSLELKNATNYDAAFYTLGHSGLLTGGRANVPKLVIFISDGYPNVYYDESGYEVYDTSYDRETGRYLDSEKAAFRRLSQVSGMNGFYALGVSNSVGQEVLDTLITYANAEHRGAFQCNDTQAIKNAFDSILNTYTGSSLKNVRIEDTLSDYAQPAGTGTSSNAAVTITVKNAEGNVVKTATGSIAAPVTLVLDKTQRNGSDTAADRTLTATYDAATKKLKLLFPENYELENHWDYQVTMAIEPTLKAYEEYRANGTYPHTGSKDTDVVVNTEVTSSNKAGFKSNSEAKLYYNDKTKDYPNPVIQTLLTEIQLLKVDGSTEQPLKDAKFTLYRKAEVDDSKSVEMGGTGLTVKPITVPAGTSTQTIQVVEVKTDQLTDANGHITFDKLVPGTYYLEEVEAPTDYTGIGTLTFTITKGDYDKENPAEWRLLTNGGNYMGCTWEWDNIAKKYTLTVPNTKSYGYELPSAGGIGTTLFYILGSILMLGAGVLLVRRRQKLS